MEARRTIVIWCAALVATVVPSHSARTRASGGNVEDVTWATIWATPLRVARQSLLLARSRVVEHRYSEASPPLVTTAEALEFFETQESGYGELGAEAEYTRRQILDCVIEIETDSAIGAIGFKPDNSNTLSKMDAWLDEIRQWDELRKTVRTTY